MARIGGRVLIVGKRRGKKEKGFGGKSAGKTLFKETIQKEKTVEKRKTKRQCGSGVRKSGRPNAEGCKKEAKKSDQFNAMSSHGAKGGGVGVGVRGGPRGRKKKRQPSHKKPILLG